LIKEPWAARDKSKTTNEVGLPAVVRAMFGQAGVLGAKPSYSI